MKNAVRFLLLVPAFAALTGCPGLGNGGPPEVQGIWSGTLTSGAGGAPVPVTAAFIAGGNAFMYVSDGELFAVSGLESQKSVSGAMLHLNRGPVSCVAVPSPCDLRFAFTGTAYSDLLVLSAWDSPGLPELPNTSGPQAFAVQLMRSNPYPTPPAPPFPDADAQWQGYYLPSGLTITLDVKTGGVFTGTDTFGCTLSGGLQEVGSQAQATTRNLFEVTFNGAFGFESRKCGVSLTGVGYLSSTGTGPFEGVPGTYFYMGVYNPDGFGEVLPSDFDTGYMVELKVR